MHLAVIFENIGGYHAARLRGAQQALAPHGGRLTAVQITHTQSEHPWGDLDAQPFPIVTLRDAARRKSKPAATLAELLDELRPDALAIPGWGFDYSRAALRWCRRHRAAAILMSESKWDDEPRAAWKEFLKSHWYVRKFHAALVGAEAHRDYLVKLGLPRTRIFTGYDVVDNEHFAKAAAAARALPEAARKRQPLIPRAPFFLAVTRFLPRKNVSLLLDAYARYRILAQGEPWHLALCGNGAEKTDLCAQASERGLAAFVHWPGFVSYREIGDWYGLAGAFVHPARHEQWGLVVNEAMAAGLPVLVSNRCGCYPELAAPAGFGFDPGDAAELARLMEKIANPSTDRNALGQSAAHQVRNFAPENFGDGIWDAINVALKYV